MKSYFRHGYLFPLPVRFLGYAIIILSLFAIIHSLIYGLLLLCIGILLGFSNYGAEIDENNQTIREYVRYFIPKFGKWFAFSEFDYISIREKKSSMRVYFSSNQSFTMKDEKFEIFLTDFLLRKKVVITEKKSIKEAEEFTSVYFKKTNIPFKSYSDIISERKMYILKRQAKN